MTRDETIKAIKLADELLVRRARESLTGFVKYIQPADMQPALHHLVMCEALNAAIEGTCKKVMIPARGREVHDDFCIGPAVFPWQEPAVERDSGIAHRRAC